MSVFCGGSVLAASADDSLVAELIAYPTTQANTAANQMNAVFDTIIRDIIDDGIINNTASGSIVTATGITTITGTTITPPPTTANNLCVGTMPTGNGVLLRHPTDREEFVIWAYSPQGYQNNLKCTWACASGYVRDGNSCRIASSQENTSTASPVTSNPQTPGVHTPTVTPPTNTTVAIWDSRTGIEMWKRAHRQVMLMGYMWTGSTLEFITPDMYQGTRFTYMGGKNITHTPL